MILTKLFMVFIERKIFKKLKIVIPKPLFNNYVFILKHNCN